jgi:hypothetical protein
MACQDAGAAESHNPFLTKRPASRGEVEIPRNIAWQTRAAPPTEHENRLGDALERIFAADIESLPELVAQLNAEGSRDPAGQPWTEGSFQEHMKQLGR